MKVLILVAQNKLFLCRTVSVDLFTLVRNTFLGVLLSAAADVFTKQSYSYALSNLFSLDMVYQWHQYATIGHSLVALV